MNNIKELLSQPALYEQMAEEAAELAQAALKYARILRGENPPVATEKDVHENLIEELTDVVHCAKILELHVDPLQMDIKEVRWSRRLLERKK